MIDLHNSKGAHVANYINGQLYSTSGRNIGHYLEQEKIFIDMNGHYLGEIVDGNRLLYKISSGYSSVSFGIYGNYGSIGSSGNYGNIGSVSYGGYRDVVFPE